MMFDPVLYFARLAEVAAQLLIAAALFRMARKRK